MPRSTPWLRDLDTWRSERITALAGSYGWWSLTCLVWLEEGDNGVGGGAEDTIPLPRRFPERVATVRVEGNEITIVPTGAADLRLDDQRFTEPHTTDQGVTFAVRGPVPLKVELFHRGGAWGARVRDPLAASAKEPAVDVVWFYPDPSFVLEGEFLPAAPGEEIAVSNVIGQVRMEQVAGRVRFEHGGEQHTLLATHAPDGELFINFRDATNQDHDNPSPDPVSYAGGRFLLVPAPHDGRVVLDFNRSFHPPCAHSDFAMCPMPTPGNRLPFAVTAGEAHKHPTLVLLPDRLGTELIGHDHVSSARPHR